MSLDNNDLLVVQKAGGGELRKTSVQNLLAQGDALWQENATTLYPKTTTVRVGIGGTLPGTPNITLNADGTAKFISGGQVSIGSKGDIRVKSGGLSYFAQFNSNIYATAFALYNTTETDISKVAPCSFIQRNDGNIYIGNDLEVGNGAVDPTNTKIALKAADGSATFAGDIGIGGTLPGAQHQPECGWIGKLRRQGHCSLHRRHRPRQHRRHQGLSRRCRQRWHWNARLLGPHWHDPESC